MSTMESTGGEDNLNSNPTIQAIKRGDVHRITSGQVVLDIQSAVKELVENSLDAGATVIEIRFKEYGADLIEVSDNGTGIEQSNYNSLALKHHTSKLQDFSDLIKVETFGFRGEALSSLCELGKVQFVTATQTEEPVGTVLEMNRDGSISNREKKVARQCGTTASVSDLFYTLPVRRKELLKNVKREFAKAQALIQAYAIISYGKRWIVSNTVKGRKNVIMTIPASNTPSYLSSNVTAVFGPKASPDLVSLSLKIPLSSAHQISSKPSKRQMMYDEEDAVEENQDEETILQVNGLISRPSIGCGRTSSDRCFLYINGRPWDSPKMVRAFNEVYRQFNIQQYPMVIADFKVQGDQYDVNVSPDKRTLFLHREGEILERLKVQLEDAFNPYQSMFRVNDHSRQEINSTLPFKPVSNRHDSDEIGEQSVWSNVNVANFANGKRRRDSSSSQNENSSQNEKDSDVGCLVSQIRQLDSDSSDPSSTINKRSTESSGTFVPQPFEESSQSSPSQPQISPSRSISSPTKRSSAGLPKAILASFVQPKKAKVSNSTRTDPRQARLDFRSNLRSFAAPKFASSQADTSTMSSLEQSESEEDNDDVEREEESDQDEEMEIEKEESEPEEVTLSDQEETNQQALSESAPMEMEEEEFTLVTQIDQPKQKDTNNDNSSQTETQSTLIESEDDDEDQIERDRNLAELNGGREPNSESQLVEEEEVVQLKGHLDGRGRVHVVFDLEGISNSLENLQNHTIPTHSASEVATSSTALQDAAIDQSDPDKVESILSRFIEKTDFEEMKILGQFNLGFIIVRRIKHEGREDDLMIVDQHAADEKYNFEQLSSSTKLHPQRLINPRTLQLSPSDELTAIEHREALNSHGFQIELDESAAPGSRVRLIALPVSGKITFNVEDLEELLNKLTDEQPNSKRAMSIRCTKLRSVLASRACRRSIMIGTALKQIQMEGVVRHLSGLDQPWNCPHGRPTMRHLYDLRKVDDSNSSIESLIDWTKFE